jgi:sugar lactone lactonase YvrE
VGYISKLGPDGKVIKSKWVTKLKAPKGMAIVKDHLYVSDVNEIVKIDIQKGKILKTWKVKKAKFLNDVVADAKGNVYISDMNDNVIHVIRNNKLSEWIRSPKLRGPNGLYTDGKEHILMGQWGSEVDPKTWMAKKPGHLTILPLKGKTPEISEQTNFSGHLDGLDADKSGNLYVSDWINGDIWQVKKNGEASRKFNFGQGTADISVAKELNLLLVPQMNQNKLIAVELK